MKRKICDSSVYFPMKSLFINFLCSWFWLYVPLPTFKHIYIYVYIHTVDKIRTSSSLSFLYMYIMKYVYAKSIENTRRIVFLILWRNQKKNVKKTRSVKYWWKKFSAHTHSHTWYFCIYVGCVGIGWIWSYRTLNLILPIFSISVSFCYMCESKVGWFCSVIFFFYSLGWLRVFFIMILQHPMTYPTHTNYVILILVQGLP